MEIAFAHSDAAGGCYPNFPEVITPAENHDWGTTDLVEEEGENLDGRLAREVPDESADDGGGDGIGDLAGGEGELRDDEVGGNRAGRLAETDAGSESAPDREPDLEAFDEGIDGGVASAEEAAVHVVPEDEDDS